MIQYTVLPHLQKLRDEGIVKELGPAYGGESIGFDLYNAGPAIEIPALLDFNILTTDPDFHRETPQYDLLDWHDYTKSSYIPWQGPMEYVRRGSSTNWDPELDKEAVLKWAAAVDKQTLISSVYKILIPTGIKVHIPQGYVGLVQERGSVSKTTLKVRAGVIDPGYTGEVFINCLNLSPLPWTIAQGEKTAFQLIVVAADNHFLEIPEDLYDCPPQKSLRGEGMLDSSSRRFVSDSEDWNRV